MPPVFCQNLYTIFFAFPPPKQFMPSAPPPARRLWPYRARIAFALLPHSEPHFVVPAPVQPAEQLYLDFVFCIFILVFAFLFIQLFFLTFCVTFCSQLPPISIGLFNFRLHIMLFLLPGMLFSFRSSTRLRWRRSSPRRITSCFQRVYFSKYCRYLVMNLCNTMHNTRLHLLY